MLEVEPLPKALFERCVAAGVERIQLGFWGGSDEGYLNVNLFGSGNSTQAVADEEQLAEALEEWAWEVYDYGGAGDGNDYGDDIEYDLVNMTTSTSAWWMSREDGDTGEGTLQVKE